MSTASWIGLYAAMTAGVLLLMGVTYESFVAVVAEWIGDL